MVTLQIAVNTDGHGCVQSIRACRAAGEVPACEPFHALATASVDSAGDVSRWPRLFRFRVDNLHYIAKLHIHVSLTEPPYHLQVCSRL